MNSLKDAFCPEKKWKNKKLTKSCPCNQCYTYKEYKLTSQMELII